MHEFVNVLILSSAILKQNSKFIKTVFIKYVTMAYGKALKESI